MSVVERYAYAIEAQTRKELGVLFHKKVFKESVEKELLLLLPEDLQQSCTMLAFMAGIAGTGTFSRLNCLQRLGEST